jgi:putative hemolysin
MSTLTIIPQIILLIVLLGASAFFAGSETALMAVSRLRLRQLRRDHPRRVGIVEGILRRPDRLISTVLLGNNLVNIGMSALATAAAISLWGDRGVIYVTVGLTIIILIFADITPKVYARYHSDRVSLLAGPVLRGMMAVSRPIVAAATWAAGRVLQLAGIRLREAPPGTVTEAEVKAMINLGREDRGITAAEQAMLNRVFTLNDRTIRDVMVPRDRMVTLNAGDTIDHTLAVIRRTGFTRYPVRDKDGGEFIGALHAKDLLGKTGRRQLKSTGIIRPLYLAPEGRTIDIQLRSFKRRRIHQALAVDGNDAVTGLVTLEDILEEMVGSIEDEFDFLDTGAA